MIYKLAQTNNLVVSIAYNQVIVFTVVNYIKCIYNKFYHKEALKHHKKGQLDEPKWALTKQLQHPNPEIILTTLHAPPVLQ